MSKVVTNLIEALKRKKSFLINCLPTTTKYGKKKDNIRCMYVYL